MLSPFFGFVFIVFKHHNFQYMLLINDFFFFWVIHVLLCLITVKTVRMTENPRIILKKNSRYDSPPKDNWPRGISKGIYIKNEIKGH